MNSSGANQPRVQHAFDTFSVSRGAVDRVGFEEETSPPGASVLNWDDKSHY